MISITLNAIFFCSAAYLKQKLEHYFNEISYTRLCFANNVVYMASAQPKNNVMFVAGDVINY